MGILYTCACGLDKYQGEFLYFPSRKPLGRLTIMKRYLICIMISNILLSFTASPLNGQVDRYPAAVIKKLNGALVKAMQGSQELGFSGRYQLLEPVVRESFAFTYMTRKSTGRYWKDLEIQQQKELLEYYIAWSVATYAKRFDHYADQRFEVLGTTESRPGSATVISHLISANNETVEFHYKLQNTEGNWRIVDIQVLGVSQLALTRAQFVSIFKRKGFNGLITSLKDKIAELSGTKED